MSYRTTRRAPRRTTPLLIAGMSLLLLAGCASIDIDQTLQDTGRATADFTGNRLALARTPAQHEARARLAAELLAQPLGQDAAVQLALAHSPALQALLAQGWGDLARAQQTGRIGNPVFSFERVRIGDELEIGRLLSIGLLDLLTLPRRQALAASQGEQVRTQLAQDVVGQVSQVRQAWVRAVAAAQVATYAAQVQDAAQASAELARRMTQAGNFNRLQRARQHVFYAEAAAQFASARQTATTEREALVRVLGLDAAQAAQLTLPERLPDLPAQPRSAEAVQRSAPAQRLDVQLARQQLDAAGRAQGLSLLTSLIDVELGARRDTHFDNASGSRATARGWEADIRLPLFDWGDARRAALGADALAAAQRYEATARAASSQLREGYSAYRSAYDLARHWRDEIVPLRAAMQEENVLRYNGMLIGVFELLADTREQIASVMQAIQAQQQFWLADAALAATLVGKPMAAGMGSGAMATPAAANAGGAPH